MTSETRRTAIDEADIVQLCQSSLKNSAIGLRSYLSQLTILKEGTVVLDVLVDRDSVAAGDDTESHVRHLILSGDADLAALLSGALKICPLASIAGGRATWLIDAGGRFLGVAAQQWPELRWLVNPRVTIREWFGTAAPTLVFRYWCQADPQTVFEALRDGAQLPDRYSRPTTIG